MSDNGKIKYTLSAEDRISDVLQRVKGSMSSLKEGVKGTASAFKTGGFKGAVTHLKGIKLNGLASSGMFKMLVRAINPATLALAALALAGKIFAATWRNIKASIGDAIVFQKHTYDLKALEGSYKSARRTMLELTEGKQAVDAEFGTDAVVKAYKNLHTYSNGALASANMVSLLGNRAKFSGKSIEEMSEIAGQAWQAISSGDGLGMAKRQLMSSMRIDASVIKELEDMQKAGASAGDVWLRLRDELEKTGNTIRSSEDSIDSLNKRIADAKGTISTTFGELFTPLVANLKYAQAFWLDAFANLIGRSKEVRAELAEQARMREAEEMNRKQAEQLEKKWDEARARQTQRREDERINAMPIKQLSQEAAKAKNEGRVADWEKITQLLEQRQAERLTADRQAGAESETDFLKKGDDVKSSVERLAKRKDDIALEDMTPEARAAEYRTRAEQETKKAAELRTRMNPETETEKELGIGPSKDMAAQAAANDADLQALNFSRLADGINKAIEAEEAASAAAKAKEKEREEEGLRTKEASRQLSLKNALASSKAQLEGLAKGSTSSIGVEERMDWMANVRGGKSPDEEISENTKEIATILKEMKKDNKGIV